MRSKFSSKWNGNNEWMWLNEGRKLTLRSVFVLLLVWVFLGIEPGWLVQEVGSGCVWSTKVLWVGLFLYFFFRGQSSIKIIGWDHDTFSAFWFSRGYDFEHNRTSLLDLVNQALGSVLHALINFVKHPRDGILFHELVSRARHMFLLG